MLIAIGSDDAFHLGVLSSRIHVTWALRAGGWLGVGNDSALCRNPAASIPSPSPIAATASKARIRAVAEELDAHRKARQAEHPGLTLTQMYNVLEKLKAGEALNAEDERIKDQGLVLILKELHERLDALVFEAYGWPATLSDEEILERLVALNKQRSIEEKTGKVRWLRPDYQIPRFGSDAEKARLEEERRRAKEERDRLAPKQGALPFEDDLQEMKRKFPTGEELAETVEVMRVLEAADGADEHRGDRAAFRARQADREARRARRRGAGAARPPRLGRWRQNRLAPRRRLTALTVQRKDRSSTVNGWLPKQAAP